jgi:hypothetical protein
MVKESLSDDLNWEMWFRLRLKVLRVPILNVSPSVRYSDVFNRYFKFKYTVLCGGKLQTYLQVLYEALYANQPSYEGQSRSSHIFFTLTVCCTTSSYLLNRVLPAISM